MQRKKAQELTRFDVAVWRLWPMRMAIPYVVATVTAPSAFAAIACIMRAKGLWQAGHAAASTCDGRLIYRAYGIRLGRESGTYSRLAIIESLY